MRGRSWFNFNNLGLVLDTNLTFYSSVEKGLKLKVEKYWGLIPTFVEVTEEKLVGWFFWPPQPEKCYMFPEIWLPNLQ